ncbi:lipoprotein heptaprenylglyceryl N-acetyltransferase LhaT [Edaphobacillus lindanitolerans]|uniref:Uncharacterized membrane protein YpjA n=1 Tax=Edaphobacillus lindanitolerans TaxID=550447 RepID=A0A1U7PL06_9BACI|nr:DUF1405 domain-containing protein [Edaphobacillus lindanitolerans]SIT66373.1 Uncharacterized membrane protein YpjA [Edaphobacillus lindanitolerans]
MQSTISLIRAILNDRRFLIVLFLVNLAGTVYGYIWYKGQLQNTEPVFLPFVPDSPTASLFFTLAVLGWIFGRHWKLIEALALITLVKYGLWAVVMNIWTEMESGPIGPLGWMLVISHFAMALEAVLYMDKYRFGLISIAIAAVWTMHDVVIDYVFGQMPVYGDLMDHMNGIGYFTFWLSVACIGIAVWSWRRRSILLAEETASR